MLKLLLGGSPCTYWSKDDFKIEPPKVNKQEISAVSGNQLTLF